MITRSVAVVSGKGGAGKTMLAMAITRELALRSRTLIVDLDVFNRGLSGLLKQGKKIADVAKPEFFPGGEDNGGWSLIEAAPNVVTLCYPDITRAQRQGVETRSIEELAADLEGYIKQLLELSNCTETVLDCHGGPDLLSFAAVSACSQTILVSEPDRITFYGTMHFLRRMAEDCPSVRPDVRLVFNKVMPAFSERYLKRFYDSEVKDLFRGQDLLAVVPFEAYLSKEFERFPFVTQFYPFSQLAGKARGIVRELRIGEERAAGQSPGKVNGVWPRALSGGGRFVPRFMNLDGTTSFTAPALTATALIAIFAPRNSPSEHHALAAAGVISIWFVEVMLVNWLNVFDRIFTRQFRLRRISTALPVFFLAGTAGLFLAGLAGWAVNDLYERAIGRTGVDPTVNPGSGEAPALTLAALLFCAVALWVVSNLIVRTIIVIWHERRYLEGMVRALGCVSGILAGGGMIALVHFLLH